LKKRVKRVRVSKTRLTLKRQADKHIFISTTHLKHQSLPNILHSDTHEITAPICQKTVPKLKAINDTIHVF